MDGDLRNGPASEMDIMGGEGSSQKCQDLDSRSDHAVKKAKVRILEWVLLPKMTA